MATVTACDKCGSTREVTHFSVSWPEGAGSVDLCEGHEDVLMELVTPLVVPTRTTGRRRVVARTIEDIEAEAKANRKRGPRRR